jgi:hypothetical protein
MNPRHLSGRSKQEGIVLVVIALSLAALVGIVGVAVDGAHGMVNKSRLQNTVDAAALSAAKTLDQTDGDVVLAEVEARDMFLRNTLVGGHAEMASSYAGGDIQVAVEFSNTLNPFVPGTIPALYVRVRATNFRLPGWFIPVMGFNEKTVAASAVAGPSPTLTQICNVAPMMVCGDPTAAAAGDPYYGYAVGQPEVLKTSTAGGDFEIGPGNFQLIRLDGLTGANDLRDALAGNYDACVGSADSIPTEPGNTVGPVVQGINTRLGVHLGPMAGKEDQYPPDVIVDQTTPPLQYDSDSDTITYQGSVVDGPEDVTFYAYDSYQADLAAENYTHQPLDGDPPGIGAYERRILALPVGDCSGTTSGQGTVPMLGVLCFFLLQEANQQGNESHVYGQFIGDGCRVSGRPGPDPVTGPGPYIIQLYKDPTWESA